MLSSLFSLQAQRERLAKKTPAGPLADFYQTPFPDNNMPLDKLKLAVLDFETTGLDLNKDHIISAGLVEIDRLGIKLDTAWHQIIKTDMVMPQSSAVIHGITDDMVAQGCELEELFSILLPKLAGKVLIAHYAKIEMGHLNKICQRYYQQPFVVPVIDTQALALRQLKRQHALIRNGDLRLFNLRNRYHLPVYKAHHALSDALATAELFLALFSDLCPDQKCQLKDVLTG